MCAKICKRNANSGCRASSQPRTYPRIRDNIDSVTVSLFVFFISDLTNGVNRSGTIVSRAGLSWTTRQA